MDPSYYTYYRIFETIKFMYFILKLLEAANPRKFLFLVLSFTRVLLADAASDGGGTVRPGAGGGRVVLGEEGQEKILPCPRPAKHE